MTQSPIPAPTSTFPVHIHHASEIRSNTTLAHQITNFVNTGYRYMSPETAIRWHPFPTDRLPTPSSIHSALGVDGFFAVIYNPNDQEEPIACAAATHWTNDLEGYSSGGEDGWEIKTVTTAAEWQRRGLAAKCVAAIVDELTSCGGRGGLCGESGARDGEGGKVKIWVHAVECLNGVLWKKLGWVIVRAYEKPVGDWGSKMGYRLLVLLQEFERK